MPSCCPLPRPPAEPPLCFPLLPLLHLPALGVLHGSLHFLRAESPLDPLKVGNCPPQGLVFQLHLLQAVRQLPSPPASAWAVWRGTNGNWLPVDKSHVTQMESAVLRSGRDNSSCHYPKSPHNLRLWHPYHGPASSLGLPTPIRPLHYQQDSPAQSGEIDFNVLCHVLFVHGHFSSYSFLWFYPNNSCSALIARSTPAANSSSVLPWNARFLRTSSWYAGFISSGQ